ncbi:MAG: hypothetical protein RLY71_1088 [Pseudomonadota bacterium]|jgi:hypothetical protein
MKRKLLATLVASALELYAASLAHAACPADGATPYSAGPVDPVSGYSQYVVDSTGLTLQRCTDAAFCFMDPIVAGNVFSEQIRSGAESFYFLADGIIDVPSTGLAVTLVMGTEATFTGTEPVDGTQLTFTRLRIWIDAPVPGIYKVTHPYGESTYTINTVGAGMDVRETFDIGFTPNSTGNVGRVGPWLRWDPAVAPAAPAGYLGDLGTPHKVIGSPCNTNFLRITGTDLNGNPINLDGLGGNTVETDLFTVNGKIMTALQTPLTPSRVTYARAAGETGRIDAFGVSTPTATMTVQDGPGTLAANSRLPNPVSLVSGGDSLFFASQPMFGSAATTTLPARITYTATDAPAGTNPSVLSVPLTDHVSISKAEYDVFTKLLTVNAASSDTRVPPVLTIKELNVAPNTPITTTAPPGRVTVTSSAGGSESVVVRVLAPTPPAAPTGVIAVANNPNSVTLTWTDNADNETSFAIVRDGVTIATLAANVTTYTDTTVVQNTTYTYQIVAANLAGGTPSDAIGVTTPGIPSAPTTLTGVATSGNTVALSWVDASNSETSFVVQSSTNNGTTWSASTSVASVTGAATGDTVTFNYPVVNANNYLFRVASVNQYGQSATYATSAVVPVFFAAAAPSAVSATAANQTVTINWTDNAIDETSFVVEGALNGGAFAQVGTVARTGTATTGTGGAVSFVYNNAAVGSWTFRVRAIGPGGASVNVDAAAAVTTTAAPILAPTSPSAVVAGQVVTISWVDASTTEASFVVEGFLNGSTTATPVATLTRTAAQTTATGTAASTTYTAAPGSWVFRIRAVDAAGTSSAGADTAAVTVAAPVTLPPGPVTAVAAGQTVTVSWTDGSNNETAFNVEGSLNGGAFAALGSVTRTAAQTTATGGAVSFTHAAAAVGSWVYRVTATGAAGASAQVTSAAVTVTAAPPATLTAPNTLTATISNATTVALRWVDRSNNENNFTVESSIDGGLSWQVSGTVTRTANQRTRTGQAVTFNAAVVMGNTYQFRVRANTTAGAFSNYATVGPVVMAVGTPTGVAAVAGATVGAATISWTDVALDAGYRVEQSADAGVTWTTAATALTNATSASVTGLTVGASYQFRVVAINGTSTATSAAVSYTVPAQAFTVTAPTGLAASVTNATTVALTWVDRSNNENTFTVDRSTDGGVTWALAGTVTRTAAQRTAVNGNVTLNTAVALGNSYQFRVRGNTTAGGTSDYSIAGPVLVDVGTPTGVAVAAGATAGVATVSWTDVVLDAGYRVEQSTDGVNWTTAATAATNATSASVTGLTVGATYQLRVVALNGTRVVPSAAVTYVVPAGPVAPPSAPLAAPTNFAITVTTVAGQLQANASWTDNSTAETSFLLQGCLGTCTTASTWSTFATVTRTGTATTGTGTTVTAVDRGLDPATTYSYRIMPRTGGTNGTPSAIVTIRTP